MKAIPLTQGKSARVDDEDYEELITFQWHAWKCVRKNRVIWYAIRTVKGGTVAMHRQVLGVTERLVQVDHQDGDGLNNQKLNLRRAVKGQNQQNSHKQRSCTSQFKGVYWSKRAKKWQAQLTVNRQWINLGQYTSESQAAEAYDTAAREHFGTLP